MAFLDPGPAIVERLVQQFGVLPTPVCVGTAIDAGAVLDAPQTDPTAWVVFEGYAPTEEIAQGAIQQIAQRWHVILKMRRVSGVAVTPGAPIADELGPVIDAVHAALCGWRPATGFDALRLDEATGATFSAGYVYYQIAFTTRTTVRGTP